ncbi:MAG: metallophosphoesterase [Spirochaetaceae bacterium]|jgi:Icc-related predicted phosphoesterase|nr:metallophosphoesterase [Spirochaetaceae bacterium]
MKILCVSDHIDPLVYSASIKERFAGIDMVLAAGDLPLDYVEFIVSSLNRPVYFVFGNHNLEDFHLYEKTKNVFMPAFPSGAAVSFDGCRSGCGAVHLGGKVKKEGGLLLAGLGGSMLYNNGENQWSELGMTARILRMIPRLVYNKLRYGRFLDIFLTHASPLGIHDKPDLCHKGFKCFLDFLRIFRPKYMVHGHIHLYDAGEIRCTRYLDSLVVNCYNHYIIEI